MVFVEANVQRDCGRDSRISYKWSISNYFDTRKSINRPHTGITITHCYYHVETLQLFNANSRSLKIPAFGIEMNYNVEDIFSIFKVIKLISLEQSADGNRYGEAANRVINFIVHFMSKNYLSTQ